MWGVFDKYIYQLTEHLYYKFIQYAINCNILLLHWLVRRGGRHCTIPYRECASAPLAIVWGAGGPILPAPRRAQSEPKPRPFALWKPSEAASVVVIVLGRLFTRRGPRGR
jgi:hypothetical protein